MKRIHTQNRRQSLEDSGCRTQTPIVPSTAIFPFKCNHFIQFPSFCLVNTRTPLQLTSSPPLLTSFCCSSSALLIALPTTNPLNSEYIPHKQYTWYVEPQACSTKSHKDVHFKCFFYTCTYIEGVWIPDVEAVPHPSLGEKCSPALLCSATKTQAGINKRFSCSK